MYLPNRLQTILALFISMLIPSSSIFSQEADAPHGPLKVLQIHITEYVIQGPLDANISNGDLLRKIEDSAKPTEEGSPTEQPFALSKQVLRFTHVVGTESSVQVGRQISIVTGEARDPRGITMRNARSEEMGTTAKLSTTVLDSGALLAQISYESRDIDPRVQEALTPDITLFSIENKIPLEPGKTTLLLGNDGRIAKAITIRVE